MKKTILIGILLFTNYMLIGQHRFATALVFDKISNGKDYVENIGLNWRFNKEVSKTFDLCFDVSTIFMTKNRYESPSKFRLKAHIDLHTKLFRFLKGNSYLISGIMISNYNKGVGTYKDSLGYQFGAGLELHGIYLEYKHALGGKKLDNTNFYYNTFSLGLYF